MKLVQGGKICFCSKFYVHINGRIIHVLRGKVLQLYKLPFNLMLEIWAFYLGYFEKRKVYELTLSN